MGVQVFEPGIQSISAGTTWTNGPGVSFANSNGVTFGLVNNTVTASVAAATAPPIAISAGTVSASSGTISFANSNGVTFGMSGSTVTASAAPLVAHIAISAGTQSASSGTISFANSNGISFGMSASSQITASVVTTPISLFSQRANFDTNYTITAGQISFQKVSLPMPLSGSSGVVLLDVAGNSNTSGGATVFIGAYALSGGTAASLTTASGGFTWTSGSQTSATSIYGGVSGTRYRSFLWGVSMTPGDYLFAFALSTANSETCRIFGRQGVQIVGTFAGAETLFFLDGVSASSSGAFPTTVFASDTNYVRTGMSAAQQPGFILIGTF